MSDVVINILVCAYSSSSIVYSTLSYILLGAAVYTLYVDTVTVYMLSCCDKFKLNNAY